MPVENFYFLDYALKFQVAIEIIQLTALVILTRTKI